MSTADDDANEAKNKYIPGIYYAFVDTLVSWHRCQLHHGTQVRTVEPSHSKGAAEVPEPLIFGAQYLTR